MYHLTIQDHDTKELYEAFGITPTRRKELAKIVEAAVASGDHIKDTLEEASKYVKTPEELVTITLMSVKGEQARAMENLKNADPEEISETLSKVFKDMFPGANVIAQPMDEDMLEELNAITNTNAPTGDVDDVIRDQSNPYAISIKAQDEVVGRALGIPMNKLEKLTEVMFNTILDMLEDDNDKLTILTLATAMSKHASNANETAYCMQSALKAFTLFNEKDATFLKTIHILQLIREREREKKPYGFN